MAAGADAIGFVFYPPSPRHISPEAARDVIRNLPPFVTTVGLVVDPDAVQLRSLLEAVPLSLLQFHGDEDNGFCAQFDHPWIKALPVRPDGDIAADIAAYPDAAGILLDTWHPQLKGGTGQTFDWKNFPRESRKPLILAGGLVPDNVAEAVRLTRPYAVDVSGGVEVKAAGGSVQKGIKDARAIKAFIDAVNAGVQ